MNKKWSAIVGFMLLVTCPALAQTFDWNLNNAGSWSLDSNWNGTPPVGGPDAADISVNITNDITAARTVSIFNTGEAGDAVKTLGILNIGDSDGSHSFTIASGTGTGSLDFNNTGGAQLNQVVGSAANTVSAPLSLTSGLTIANASVNSLTLSGAISGVGSLAVNSSGSGVVNLTSANTHSGGTTLTAGTLRLGNNAAVGTGTLTLNGGTLSSDSATARTISNTVSLGGNIGLGQTSGGTGGMTFSGATTLTANSVITTNQATTYSGTITDGAGSFSLTKNGTGTLSMSNTTSGAYAFDGGLFFNSGTLLLATNSNGNTNYRLGTGAVTFSGGSVLAGQNIRLNNDVVLTSGNLLTNFNNGGNNTHQMVGVWSGDGGVEVRFGNSASSGSAFSLLNGSNTFSGGITLDQIGTGSTNIRLVAATNNALGTGLVTLNDGVLVIGGSVTSNNLVVGSGSSHQTIAGLSSTNAATSVIGNSNFSGGSNLTLNVSDVQSFEGVIGGAGSNNNNLNLIKSGAGTQVLAGANTYTGTTTVNAGTLLISGTGSINSSSGVTVGSGGNFRYNSSTAFTSSLTLNSGGALSGSGNLGTTTISVVAGSTLSPGNSPGTQNTGTQTWFNDGNYNWQLLDATGAAGTGYDTIAITGGLDLTNLTGLPDFNINLWTLSSIGPDVNGDALNFNLASNYSWLLVSTTTGITGFDASEFTINTAAFNGTSGFSNDFTGGSFSVSVIGNDLFLNYTAIPEPSTYALLGFGLGALWFLRRRKA